MRIAYFGGFWATNIGNSFYNLGAVHALETAVPTNEVHLVPDLTRWFWKTSNSYDVAADLDVDLWVFSGPFFSSDIDGHRAVFEKITARGGRFAFISVGSSDYSDDEWTRVRSVLEPFGDALAFVSTRDEATYRRAAELSCPVHNGICTSMFLDDAVSVPSLDRPPYVVLNFNSEQEPIVSYENGTFDVVRRPKRATTDRSTTARLRNKLSRDGGPSESYPTSVGPFDIIRTRSKAFQRDPGAVFDRPNMHFADIPQGYLCIYKSAEIVFSDRVHTCASTLILGGTARYVPTTQRSVDGRFELLDRVGAGTITTEPVTLDQTYVSGEKQRMLAFLREVLAGP